MSKSDKVTELADRIRKEVGEVSVLVNNAGIMPCKKFLDHDEAEIKKMFDINVFAHFWVNYYLITYQFYITMILTS